MEYVKTLFMVLMIIVCLSACDSVPRTDVNPVVTEFTRPRHSAAEIIAYNELIRQLPVFSNPHALYFVDAHSQISAPNLELTIINRMNANYVCRTLLSGRRAGTPEVIARVADNWPARITAAARSKGSAYSTNQFTAFLRFFQDQVSSGKFAAMGEALVYHDVKNGLTPPAPEVEVRLTDPRIGTITSIARRQHWPVILHIEFASEGMVAGNPANRARHMRQLRDYLNTNSDIDVIVNQMGQLSAEEVLLLLNNHPNLYFTTAQTTPVRVFHSMQPWVNLFAGYTLKPQWALLFKSYPERILFALDNVTQRHWRDFYHYEMRFWMSAMNSLPNDIAHKIAHQNAERLWRLPVDPGCPVVPARPRLDPPVPKTDPAVFDRINGINLH